MQNDEWRVVSGGWWEVRFASKAPRPRSGGMNRRTRQREHPPDALAGLCGAVVLAIFVLIPAAPAEVVKLEIERREPFAAGQAFGQTGPYEKVTGRIALEVDPDDPANGRIVDLRLAPRNDRGRVEFSTDFFLLKPADPARGNRRLLFGVANRGNKLLLGAFNDARGNDPTTAADAGNGFLMRQGYAVLWCGWNGDVLPGGDRLCLRLPMATKDGRTITGRIYSEICVDRESRSEPLWWGGSDVYPTVDLDDPTAVLSMRPVRSAPGVVVPRDRWAFARWTDGKAVPDPRHVFLQDGFRPGRLYDLVYTGKDPRVTGLGFAAVRDVVSFFRYEPKDSGGTENPLAGGLDRAYVFGISQSGRFIHHFLYEGFNADERRRMVFDAAMPHVAGGGKGYFNHRFAQTTRYASPHEGRLFPCDTFPFTSTPETDPVTGQTGDTLARCRAAGCVPKVFFVQTSAEYWCRAASLLHTDVEGRRDVPPDPNVRIYFIAGAQHIVSASPDPGIYQHQRNTLDHRPVLRALLVALDRWASEAVEPPPSKHPRIDDGTLVDLQTYRRAFPKIPGVEPPKTYHRPLRLDFGPRWESEGIADRVPPKVGPAYVTLLPAVDADGNATAGIRLPEVAVPLSTYTGWNLRGADCGAEGMPARFYGSQFPFARTAADREQSGDPRPAVAERYPTREDYVRRVEEAAGTLCRKRFLLGEDATAIVKKAAGQRHWSRR